MHVVYFVQYFNLPDEPGGSRPYQFAREWTRAGHRVTVVTGAVNHKTLTVPERYRGRLFARETIDGIDVVRVWSYAGIRGSFRKRILNFLSYAAIAALAGAVRVARPDVVYASSTPLFAGIPGLTTAVLRRAPFVFEARDLWPDSAVVAGVLRERALPTRAALWLSHLFYRRARRLVGVTRGICDGMAALCGEPGKVIFVPNGVDDWMLDAGDPEAEPAGDEFRVCYVGAHGRWNGLGQILDAAALLREDPAIAFEFTGDGDDRAHLAARARDEHLARVRFHGAVPKREAFAAIRRAHASIVVTWAHPFQRMVLANKIFDYLAAGRPVIVGAEGEMAALVREAGCGIVVPPENPSALAQAIRELRAMSVAERREMGMAGRRYILARYQRTELATRLLGELEAVSRGKSAPTTSRGVESGAGAPRIP